MTLGLPDNLIAFFIGSKSVRFSVQPDNPFVNNANFFPMEFPYMSLISQISD